MQNSHLAWVFLGGGLGAVCRYALSSLVMTRWTYFAASSFPVGILTCNIMGSFLIGVFAGSSIKFNWLSPFLITGFLGGFTTFSSFSLETQKLWTNGQVGLAGGYVFTSIALSLLFCFLGYSIIQEI